MCFSFAFRHAKAAADMLELGQVINMEFWEIEKIIEKHDSIVIYRHINPDYDAFGGQLGLKHLIMDNWPDKKVYAYGKEMLDNPAYLEPMDEVDEDTIRDSLVITVDTSTNARSDDRTFLLGKQILKIDHHLRSEEVTKYAYVDPEASSVCEIITNLAMKLGWVVSQRAAELLLGGMLSDSQRLSTPAVTGDTFRAAAFLADQLIDVSWVNRCVYDNSIEEFQASVAFQNKIRFTDDLAYFITSRKDKEKFNIDEGEIKDFVDLMANIKGVDKYAVFAQMDNGNYTVSLRSHKPSIVHIARKYGGGGHALACGIPEVTKKQVDEIIEMLLKAR